MNSTLPSSAEPGRSQHQLGTTVDLVFASVGFKFSFAMDKTAEMKWLLSHAHEFGYILSYSWSDDDQDGLGYNSKTGYYYEPWHWRYIGVEEALQFKESGLLPDDFFHSYQ
jgi:D-alanyl-D-alanine carboxypeptidase